jgi:aryl-alcohol dehydrogenase
VTIGDARTQTLIPAMVRLHAQGRLPVEKLITPYAFSQIQDAADDIHAGRTIKPVLRFGDRQS